MQTNETRGVPSPRSRVWSPTKGSHLNAFAFEPWQQDEKHEEHQRARHQRYVTSEMISSVFMVVQQRQIDLVQIDVLKALRLEFVRIQRLLRCKAPFGRHSGSSLVCKNTGWRFHLVGERPPLRYKSVR